MKQILFSLITALVSISSIWAQAPSATAEWSVSSVKALDESVFEIILTADIEDGWHTYGLRSEVSPTTLSFSDSDSYSIVSEPVVINETENQEYSGQMQISFKVKALKSDAVLKGEVSWMSCTGGACAMPEFHEFEQPLQPERGTVVSMPENSSSEGSLWTLIIEAILWGFAMLLTPCVFPMVPMTLSFFIKGSSSKAAGRFKAFMYGLFIVLLYTVPISLIILFTWILGGDSVTADIFNWLATHWLPNLIFFAVFMVFAASFFGAFEITLPASIVNKSDKNSDRAGLAGVFFMALTLVLVSFSCTGPIVGTVLIKSTQGEFWTPMITMLAFSVAFALPFTVFALFPSLLKKLKSGSWLNSVKVVLGFIEVALGFKFLSTADQTYHWGLLDREVYLAIWIVTFSLLGLYLLGKIRFAHDDPSEKPLSVFRLSLVIAVFSFVVYLIPGMWGAPLKALSGYLPPIQTQDFIVSGQSDMALPVAATLKSDKNVHGLEMPLGLSGYFTIEDGLEASAKEGKPVFIDITGHGCVNCREMEQRVWSDPRVLSMLRDEFIIVALYVDDKSKLDESEWLITDTGKVLKDLGRKNSYIVRERFGVNAQPNYCILDSEGNQLVPVRGYNLDVEGFISYLQSGLDKYKNWHCTTI